MANVKGHAGAPISAKSRDKSRKYFGRGRAFSGCGDLCFSFNAPSPVKRASRHTEGNVRLYAAAHIGKHFFIGNIFEHLGDEGRDLLHLRDSKPRVVTAGAHAARIERGFVS